MARLKNVITERFLSYKKALNSVKNVSENELSESQIILLKDIKLDAAILEEKRFYRKSNNFSRFRNSLFT